MFVFSLNISGGKYYLYFIVFLFCSAFLLVFELPCRFAISFPFINSPHVSHSSLSFSFLLYDNGYSFSGRSQIFKFLDAPWICSSSFCTFHNHCSFLFLPLPSLSFFLYLGTFQIFSASFSFFFFLRKHNTVDFCYR